MSRPKFSDEINAHFIAAIDHLQATGSDVTFAAVARMAKHARGLISQAETNYGEVRSRILAIRAEGVAAKPVRKLRSPVPKTTRDEEVLRLRDENKLLSAQVKALQNALAANIAATSGAVTGTAGRQQADLERRRAARAARQKAEAPTSAIREDEDRSDRRPDPNPGSRAAYRFR